MRKIIAIGAALILSACANPQQAAYQAKQAAMMQQTQQDSAAVSAGAMKQSEYYARMYEMLSRPPVSQMDYGAMPGASRMIDVSRRYEAGLITKDDFDSAKRQTMIEYQGFIQQARAQAAAQAEANRQAAVSYYLQTRPVTTNCTRYGNNVSCTGY